MIEPPVCVLRGPPLFAWKRFARPLYFGVLELRRLAASRACVFFCQAPDGVSANVRLAAFVEYEPLATCS
eukprot:7272941-Lingulodinium_polyedra.AAC.1